MTAKQEEKREIKTILFISDDFSDLHWKSVKKRVDKGNYFGSHTGMNTLQFKCEIVELFEDVPQRKLYDAVLIDYGLLEEQYLYILKDFYEAGTYLIWCGGLGEWDLYNQDVQKIFPKQKFLHQLKSCTIDPVDILDTLYCVFGGKRL